MLTATWVVTMTVLGAAFVMDNAVLTFTGVALGLAAFAFGVTRRGRGERARSA